MQQGHGPHVCQKHKNWSMCGKKLRKLTSSTMLFINLIFQHFLYFPAINSQLDLIGQKVGTESEKKINHSKKGFMYCVLRLDRF